MTEISKAAQQALDALIYHVEQTRPIERTTQAITALRAALQDKAVEVRGERDAFEQWLGIKPCGAAHDFGWQAWKARAAQPAPVVPDDHPLMVFARECELGTYMEHETPMAARKAISAAKAIGITAKAEGGA